MPTTPVPVRRFTPPYSTSDLAVIQGRACLSCRTSLPPLHPAGTAVTISGTGDEITWDVRTCGICRAARGDVQEDVQEAAPDHRVTQPRVEGAGLVLERGRGAPRLAREYVAGKLRGLGVAADAVDDAMLIVSELVTNALVHGEGALRVRIDADADTGSVRLTVADERPYGGLPLPAQPGHDAEAGRGLLLVDALSMRWGSRPVAETPALGTAVWVDLVVVAS
jgi:anti-sigma regulatory factor (Ser/Thr protein kinase)